MSAPRLLSPSWAAWVRRHRRLSLAVLMGGTSSERTISLHSGRGVLAALQRCGLKAWGLDLRTWRDVETLRKKRPDVAVLCLHGPGGEDGKIQGVLEWMGIPYTGSGVLASALAMDKARTKDLLKRHGLPTAPWALLTRTDGADLGRLKLPVVVKPNHQGSAVGISIVRDQKALAAAVRLARKYDDEVLVEAFCPGKELTVGVLGHRPLPVIEIVPKQEFYNYQAKYVAGQSEHLIPPRVPAAVSRRAQVLAQQAHAALGCRGASRVDLIAGPGGTLNILEVNTLPGMTDLSLLPEAARAAGISYEELVVRLAAEGWEQGQ